jgi:twitching motility protein PilT
MFPTDAAHQVRSMLALTLQAVVSQRLVRRADGHGRTAAVEVMVNSPNIRELIAEGKTAQIEKVMALSGDYYKMQTFNQALVKLTNEGVITQEEALSASSNPGDLKLALKGISGAGTAGAKPSGDTGKMGETTRMKINRTF